MIQRWEEYINIYGSEREEIEPTARVRGARFVITSSSIYLKTEDVTSLIKNTKTKLK